MKVFKFYRECVMQSTYVATTCNVYGIFKLKYVNRA